MSLAIFVKLIKQDQRSQKLTLRETKKAKSNRKVPNPEISLSTAIYKT